MMTPRNSFVTFASQGKMAALDVVKRRLDKIGLGGPCLELHSNRTNKKSIIEELKRTVASQNTADPNSHSDLAVLTESRSKLNEYCVAVNSHVANSGESPHSAFGKQMNAATAMGGVSASSVRLDAAATWTAVDSARRALLVKKLQGGLIGTGIPSQHVFWGSGQ